MYNDAVDTIDLESARGLRLTVVDEADLRGGDIPIADGQRNIGEGAADVDGKSDGSVTQDEIPLRGDREPVHQLQNGHTWYQLRHLKRSSH